MTDAYRGDLTNVSVTYPAFAADTLGETLTLTFPAAWRERVDALADRFTFGPNYSRAIVETILDMSRQARDGDDLTLAAYSLESAERIAARNA